jgi:arthrofactin-type cyclic lipopeptide synthetase A
MNPHPRTAQVFPLTAAQSDIWLDQLSRADSPRYNIGGYVELQGPVDPELMQRAIEALVHKHDALRTELLADAGPGGLPLQRFAREMPVPMPLYDLSQEAEPKVRAQSLMQQHMARVYALYGEPLFRFFLVKLGPEHYWLGTQAHHLILDGWGFGQMLHSLGGIYSALVQGQSPELEAASYIDFIHDDARYHGSPRYARDRAYWLDTFRSLPEPLLVPRHRDRYPNQAAPGANLVRPFPAALHERMKACGKTWGASAFHVWLAALYVYFTRTSERDEWVVGLPILNRSNARFRSTLGLFTQVSAVRLGFARELSFAELVAAIRDAVRQDFRHQRFPLSEMNRELGVWREGRGQLFDLSLSYEQDDHDYRYGEAQAQTIKVPNNHEPMPLVIHLRSNCHNDQAWIHYVYNQAYFQPDEVEALAERLTHVLEQGLAQGERAIGDFSLMTAREAARIHAWNATTRRYPQAQTLHSLFEQQVLLAPEAPAAVHGAQSLSYGELNRRANQLARHLMQLGVKPGDNVAVLLPRSEALLVSQLAISKCAAVYVPLDINAPAERQLFMVNDSLARVLLTLGRETLACPAQRIELDRLALDHQPAHNLDLAQSSESVAYIMYTSGSTGSPKGVLVPHRAVSRLVLNNGYAEFNRHDRVAFASNPAFDASTLEVWAPLLNGGCVVVVDQDVVLSSAALGALLLEQRVSVLWMTAGLFHQHADGLLAAFRSLRYLIVGGDVLDPAVIARVLEQGAPQHLLNGYGPTEATTFSTTFEIHAVSPGSIPIGRPIGNSRAYVLDARQRQVAVGVVGELYVGGAGVALGYLNQPQLTAEKFMADPFVGSLPGDPSPGLMYRTGDLACWREDGVLLYQGRNDQQVKLRGFRIELGEIETRLAHCAGVKDSALLLREDSPGDKRLVAYFTPQDAAAHIDIKPLHEALQGQLPDYMLPAAYVQLPALPLTANGKLDRKALPAPDASALLRRDYEAPQGEVEVALAQIWAELLQVEQVGRQDHFFELGGHSLLAVGLIERMRQLGFGADVRVLFSQPTLAALAAAVGNSQEVQVPANRIAPGCTHITPQLLPLASLDQPTIDRIVAGIPGGAANVQDIYPLAPLQEGLLYHHISAERGDPYQQHAMFAFSSRERLDAFARALQQVIERHDILRTSLAWDGLEQPMQVVWRQAQLGLEQVLLEPQSGDILGQLAARFDPGLRPLDIRQAPMMALAWAEDPLQQRWVGMLRFHHLVNDATSTAVLIGEIQAHLNGQQAQLPPAVAYRNVVAQARQAHRQAEHQGFFRQMLGDVDEPTLAFGLQAYQVDRDDQQQAHGLLDAGLGQRLREQARQLGVSAASLYHLAWAQVLGSLAGRDDVVFGTVLLGRLQAGEGADRALGMFINTLPLRVRLAGCSVAQAILDTHAGLSDLLAHEHAALALAQRCSAVAAPTPLFNTLLNYRHAAPPEDQVQLPGIELVSSEEIVSYPLSIAVDDLQSGFRLSARAPGKVGAQRLLDYLQTALGVLVQALEQAPRRPLAQLSILPPAERQHLLIDLNATAETYAHDQTLHALIEAQVRRTPDAVALVAGEQQLSYGELNARANQLAHHLREQGVQPDSRVGICVERGLELLVGLLGILKAGGAYVPLDPSYPPERLAYMVQDSAPVAVLVHGPTRELMQQAGVPLIDFDASTWQHQPLSDPQVPGLGVSNLAYVIYTSGSTGTPKGVMVEHRGLGNLMHWSSGLCPAAASGSLLQKAPFSFDGSVWELFWPLSIGMRMVLARPDGHREPAYLAQLIREQQITVVKFVPAMLQQFLELEEVRQCHSLTDVFAGGGELTEAMARRFQQQLPQARLHNVYGPTETTVDSSAWTLEPGAEVPSIQLPIGRPISNTRLYVLDAHDAPVPMGVSGQLHIGGVGVARGYLGLSGLMAERFIDSPFVAGDRLYRTGDLVRYRADGNLEFLGRNDFQVKLHGLRVELGEIEARLASHPALREVVVLMRDGRLVSYFTVRQGEPAPAIEALRDHVLAQLPEYMVPSAFVQLPAWPLSPNGKLDRQALPAPGQDAVLSRGYEAPQGEVEIALAQIWAEVLKIERVGRHDHFFELGGHSLLAVSLVARMRQAGLNADARLLFSQPTLAALAAKALAPVQQIDVPQTTIPQLTRKRRL